MNNKIYKISATLLAVMMVVFGLNKFLGFIAVNPPVNPTAQAFMGAMFTSYLFAIVAIIEIVGGVLLVIPRTKFLGWLLLVPVVFNIALFHFAHDFVGNGLWLLPTLLMMVIGYFNKEKITALVK